MPVRTLRAPRAADHDDLVRQLRKEWTHPEATEPVILEDFDQAGALAHVFVVWSAWPHVDRAERGEIIMEAAEARHGSKETASVTVAMGLTPDEADRMGLPWR